MGGLNPTAAKKVEMKNGHWEAPCTESVPMVQQDLGGRPANQCRTMLLEK